jgi:hypothetical protein
MNQALYVTVIFLVTLSSSQSFEAPLSRSLAIYSQAKTLALKNNSYSFPSFRHVDNSCLKRIRRKRSRVVSKGPIAIYFTFLLERSYITNL